MLDREVKISCLGIAGDGPDWGRLPFLNLSPCLSSTTVSNGDLPDQLCAESQFTTFSDGCLGSNNDEGRSEV